VWFERLFFERKEYYVGIDVDSGLSHRRWILVRDGILRGRFVGVIEPDGQGFVEPIGSDVWSDADSVAQTKRWDDRRATGKDVYILGCLAHDLKRISVRGLGAEYLRSVCRLPRLHKENPVEIAKSPANNLANEFIEPIQTAGWVMSSA